MGVLKSRRGRVARAACVVCLVAVQALCALMLAWGVRDLVCVGIGRGGFAGAVCPYIHMRTLASLEESMDAGEVALVEASYSAPNLSGIRTFCGTFDQLRDTSELSGALVGPEASAYRSHHMDEAALDDTDAAACFVAQTSASLGFDLCDLQCGYLLRQASTLAAYLLVGLAAALACHHVISHDGPPTGEKRVARERQLAFSNALGA